MPIAQNLLGNERVELTSKKHWIGPVRDPWVPVLSSSEHSSSTGSRRSTASSSADAAAALASLADLRDRGAITPQEYEAKKTKILALI